MMEAIFYSETCSSFRDTWRYNPQDLTLYLFFDVLLSFHHMLIIATIFPAIKQTASKKRKIWREQPWKPMLAVFGPLASSIAKTHFYWFLKNCRISFSTIENSVYMHYIVSRFAKLFVPFLFWLWNKNVDCIWRLPLTCYNTRVA
jgi:hypothetical protein